jgi:hypothetical protein
MCVGWKCKLGHMEKSLEYKITEIYTTFVGSDIFIHYFKPFLYIFFERPVSFLLNRLK